MVSYGVEDVVGCDGGEGPPSVGSQGNHIAKKGASRERRVDISWGGSFQSLRTQAQGCIQK